jgi:hypothetical protein
MHVGPSMAAHRSMLAEEFCGGLHNLASRCRGNQGDPLRFPWRQGRQNFPAPRVALGLENNREK